MRRLVPALELAVDEGTGLAPLVWRESPDPVPGPGEVVIAVSAAGVNRADLMQRAGRYPPPPGASDALGLEAAGSVLAVGDGVRSIVVGQRVCTLLPGGGYATHAVAPAELVIPVWDDMDDVHAAALPEVFMTAYAALFEDGRAEAGETVLVHAAASGVGTAALQLAHAVGCRVVATCGGPEKVAACMRLGASLAIDRHEHEIEDAVRADVAAASPGRHVGPGGSAGPGPIDVIIDMVGRDYFSANLRLLAVGGRLVFVAAQSGADVPLSIYDLTSKRLHLVGTTLRARSVCEKVALKDALMARFGASLRNGSITPLVDSVFPIDEVEAAHARMLANENIGKIVLRLDGA